MTQNQSLFFQKFGLTPNDLQSYLGEALSAGGEYADLYFEYLTSTSISVDESMVKSASQGISAGCGVRVLAGERTGHDCDGRRRIHRLVCSPHGLDAVVHGRQTQHGAVHDRY